MLCIVQIRQAVCLKKKKKKKRAESLVNNKKKILTKHMQKYYLPTQFSTHNVLEINK